MIKPAPRSSGEEVAEYLKIDPNLFSTAGPQRRREETQRLYTPLRFLCGEIEFKVSFN